MMVTITSKQIYNKLLDIEQHVIKTNGRVTLNKWIATTALTLIMSIVVIMLGIKLF